MKDKKSLIYSSINHEIHYIMSFIGGGVEIISFIYLYKALIGFMTSNMIFGINTFANGGMDYVSLYHIIIVVIWMIIAAIHQIIFVNCNKVKMKTPWHGYAIALTVNCLLLALFMFVGQYMRQHGVLEQEPTPAAMPLVIIGLIFMYIQNFLIKNGGTPYPTTTSVVTTVYVLMATRISGFFNKNCTSTERKASLQEGLHYALVLIHFAVGAYVTAKLSSYFGFYSLLLMLLALVLLTLRVWLTHYKYQQR